MNNKMDKIILEKDISKIVPFITYSVLNKINHLGIGQHSCGFRKGFITIENVNGSDNMSVHWTSHKKHHNVFGYAPSVYCEFNEIGYCYVFESVLSMWPIYNIDDRKKAVHFILKKIDQAFDKSINN